MKQKMGLFLAVVFSALFVQNVSAHPLPYPVSHTEEQIRFSAPLGIKEDKIISTAITDEKSPFKKSDITTADMEYSSITHHREGLLTTATMTDGDDITTTATLDNNSGSPHVKGTMLYTVRGISVYKY